MATIKIKVENGYFFAPYCEKSKEFDKNGFRGEIRENGEIRIERYKGDGGVFAIFYPDGRYKFDNRGIIKRGRCSLDENGNINGTIGLHTSTRDKYIYFRDAVFQEFLEKHGITAVKKQNPNSEFVCRSAYHGGGTAYCGIRTDGSYTEKEEDLKENLPDHLHESRITYAVKDATYVIVEQGMDLRDRHNYSSVLYTLEKDVTKLNIV